MYFPPILHYLLYYFKHIGKHMTKSESARTENMYNFANQHQQDTNKTQTSKNLYSII